LRDVEGDFKGREALLNVFAFFSEIRFGLRVGSLGNEIKSFCEFLPSLAPEWPALGIPQLQLWFAVFPGCRAG
jgi:hypothetical protein